jgi:hypothetical protein
VEVGWGWEKTGSGTVLYSYQDLTTSGIEHCQNIDFFQKKRKEKLKKNLFAKENLKKLRKRLWCKIRAITAIKFSQANFKKNFNKTKLSKK